MATATDKYDGLAAKRNPFDAFRPMSRGQARDPGTRSCTIVSCDESFPFFFFLSFITLVNTTCYISVSSEIYHKNKVHNHFSLFGTLETSVWP